MTRFWLTIAALVTACWSAGAIGQTTATECPPELRAPTPEQMHAAARDARDHGMLWRIRRGGASSYLFGTIHVGKLEWVMPGPRLRAALAAVDTIALEIDPTDARLAERMVIAGGDARRVVLPSALAERLSRRLDSACLPAPARPAIEAMHPLMQALTLSVLEARWEGLDAGFGQEVALAGIGRASQQHIVSLETPESQMAALMPKGSDEMQRAIAGTLDQVESGATRRTLGRLAAAWARGDLGEIEQYERWCECVPDEDDRRMLKRLLDDRNPAMARRIDALHRAGHKVLAAVGALHMVGPKGLPALLRAQGFTVERLAFQ